MKIIGLRLCLCLYYLVNGAFAPEAFILEGGSSKEHCPTGPWTQWEALIP